MKTYFLLNLRTPSNRYYFQGEKKFLYFLAFVFTLSVRPLQFWFIDSIQVNYTACRSIHSFIYASELFSFSGFCDEKPIRVGGEKTD